MTLKERFKQWLDTNPRLQIREFQLELIADEHAIAFTDWCEDYYYPSSTKGIWFDKPDFDNAKQFLTKELLKIYKNEKGL
jgi:hypothetical protein